VTNWSLKPSGFLMIEITSSQEFADSDEGGQLFRLKAASDSDRLRTPFR
jgi:hypothetical protein